MNKLFISLLILLSTTGLVRSQTPDNKTLLSLDSLIFLKSLGQLDKKTLNLISVAHQPFNKAYQLSTFNNTNRKSIYLECQIKDHIEKGDIMLLSFYTRSVNSIKETGESFIELSLNRTINGKYEWPPLLARGLSFGKAWVLTQIPFTAAMSVMGGDLSLVIKPGDFPQEMEIGGLSLINYKKSVKMANLPKSIVHYDGDAPDAKWRKAAEERIEKYRKGNLSLHIVDKYGKPVPGVKVSVNMKKSAFAFGTAVNSSLLLDTVNNNSKIYRDTLFKYFNKIVFENEVKSRNWRRSDHNKTIQSVRWLKSHQINVRGHVMVWPSWQNSPHLLPYKNDTAGLRKAIMADIIDETRVLKGQFDEWDVVNEPFAHNVFLNLLGRHAMVDWFDAARRLAPGVKLFLNDYTMFHGEGPGSASEKFYENIKYLKDQHATIDAIGEQGHIGGTPPGIEYIIGRLNHFSQLGLPIQISEFDITSDDDEFKARYLRDFMTAIFSHPATIGIVQWGFWEGSHWIPAAAMWDKNWKLREHGRVYTKLVTRTWRTNERGVTDKDGNYSLRAFNGDYVITIEKSHKKQVLNTRITVKGQKLAVSLK